MAERKATVLLEHHLKQLKLPTFLRDYASVFNVSDFGNDMARTLSHRRLSAK